jgi:hypothetical protein
MLANYFCVHLSRENICLSRMRRGFNVDLLSAVSMIEGCRELLECLWLEL